MDMIERCVFWLWLQEVPIITYLYSRIIREATTKSKDGRIDQTDFLDHAASSSRYSLFTPMEASIIFHFAGRGIASQRLSLLDFAQLLDPRWKAPHDQFLEAKPVKTSFLQNLAHSAYSFVQGGMWWLSFLLTRYCEHGVFRNCWFHWGYHGLSYWYG